VKDVNDIAVYMQWQYTYQARRKLRALALTLHDTKHGCKALALRYACF
jgi:hypothetical protein